MCGIVGYVGSGDSVGVILSGLRRLEYRGYDSAGISVVDGDELSSVKSLGKLSVLEKRLSDTPVRGSLGIGHTRWATHGVPSEANSHPQFDDELKIAVVHNGIIENYQEIGASLRADGVHFRSETDTETIAHLIRLYYSGDLFEAVRLALREVKGAYALGVVCKDNPDVLVAARQGSPLIVGLGEDSNYIASDATAILEYTRDVLYLEDGQICELRRDGYRVQDLEGTEQTLDVHTIDWDQSQAEKSGYPHYMLKEIHEQPEVIEGLLRGQIAESGESVVLEDLNFEDGFWETCPKIFIVACGTAWHAALYGKRVIESMAGIPVEVDIASEFRYRDLLIPEGTVVIPVTQSGETADTLEATRIAKAQGARVLSLVNVVGSSITRISDSIVYLRAGLEIGVCSSKAYTAMMAAFGLLGAHLAEKRGTKTGAEIGSFLKEMGELPDKIRWCLEHDEAIVRCAEDARFRDAVSTFFLGRGYNFPSALEGALKLKEISYIHAEGYGAGEMKHGPIALVTDELPVICIATKSNVYEKVVSNMQEIRARNGILMSIATEGDEQISECCEQVIYVPECSDILSPIINAVPMQLFAYHVSVNRGCDVDQPRNLAKSVTVE